ncbi:UDP-N-acetylmuramoyl-tripeptide--D-alanyl-D-alanine ligase [Endozoicomonas sp. G2_1]|uniref:UDP-N-acetylmuramoyl-tripeptide--D-alanyl-D- alanine ligase n=1 Tax=Endozoicomonas sp. G2_1 TaxID=2821091 RepID=UPI001ADC9C1F|nr:UDP-N-acetylmuramoyl-tripeptide--D-alanyl-D-alanine ligase [Endozoicomonas sp. G2_1]MBO9491069.1 UDP-N-acetylmuramoyl-tripeptide--D-alanyl-D-alanine ligase [Endozoicomonas sp. G2_1]
MISLSLATIAEVLSGRLVGADKIIDSVTTDSRALAPEQVFLALKGPNFDGHKFAQQACSQGASALIVSEQQALDISQVIVEDTHRALGQLAAYVKQQVAPKTVAITGSSGKTTVREMVAAVLSRLGKVLVTDGNFNNDIGVPLTLLRLEQDHHFAVVELGANHIGEIAYTTGLTKPDVALINNIGAAHIEGFGSLCGVARAKGEIYQGLAAGGIAIYNQACSFADKWQQVLADKTVRQFACDKDFATSDVDYFSSDAILDDNGCASFRLHTPVGSTFVQLTVPGEHNICNAVAAATICLSLGASLDDIALGLSQMSAVKGRLNLHQLGANTKLIDDSYNANVASIKAAIKLLATYPGKRILALGDMAELGAEARAYHAEIGQFAAEQGIEVLLGFGVLSQHTVNAYQGATSSECGNGQHFYQHADVVNEIISMLEANSNAFSQTNKQEQQVSMLVKGSRSARMEQVVQGVLDWYSQQSNGEQS